MRRAAAKLKCTSLFKFVLLTTLPLIVADIGQDLEADVHIGVYAARAVPPEEMDEATLWCLRAGLAPL
ncbi:hypothetical protein ASE72_18275 [Sphingomonas sp. Leaf20]|nr:hypothetical protein ASE72_18275 [Sphingomonas sp. Leaf20]